jgi:outer membrane receptor protein involved in Fe transport/Tfp pilus assembly protein PilF
MNGPRVISRLLLGFGLLFFPFVPELRAQANRAANDASVLVIVMEGTVEVAPSGTDVWAPAKLNQKLQQGDKLRTGKFSRATLRSATAGEIPVRESSLITINPPRAGSDRPVFELVRGFFYFFTRGQPTDIEFRNRLASAAARGTEFTVFIDPQVDQIEINVFDGIVELTNAQGSETATNGERVVAAPGQKPAKSPALAAINLVQWVLYYPGVLDVDELGFDAAANDALRDSLSAFRRGDLVRALTLYPDNRQPATDNEKIYRAALMLVVGEVDQAAAMLNTLTQPSEFSASLRKLIAAVRNEVFSEASALNTGTAWLAESYYQQSRLNLEGALKAARSAAERRPEFGFAWARIAELEFSFGRVDPSLQALERALKFSPRHAGAMALRGFLLSAQNRIPEAYAQFNEAIATDGALADAWLGRGLVRIRLNDARGGREDIRTAAALEPNRAVLRSYLAKAFSDVGGRKNTRLAEHEFDLSRQLDPNDPTVWLYRALHDQQHNRINEAIRELEHSQDLNTNRAVYRSQMLLDQDQAVRSANLAGIYYDAGMTDVSTREAGRAVSSDYGNYSAHLFLANSYDRLRDPKQINLRYETPAFAEYLIANLLAPVGAGTLSPSISQQEYSKLFERNGFGISSRTEYRTGGNWFEEGAQYGTFGNVSYSIEGLYRSDHGHRQNNDIEQRQFGGKIKQQLAPHDTLYLEITDYRAHSGDVGQYFYKSNANLRLRTQEFQEPVFLAGLHHEWSPGNHTLFLGSRLDDTYKVENPQQQLLVFALATPTKPRAILPTFVSEDYESKLEIYSGELQQILQRNRFTTVLGTRYQFGEIATDVKQDNFINPRPFPEFNPLTYTNHQEVSEQFHRFSLYAYETVEIFKWLHLIGGVTYDNVKYPRNFRFAPVQGGDKEVERVSPKAGLIWTPTRDTTVRFGYSQSVGGASIDQSYQIEPSQIAGFNQSFRSIIPESVAAAQAGALFETLSFSVEQRLPTDTYLGVGGEQLKSSANHDIGVALWDQTAPIVFTNGMFTRPPTNTTTGHTRQHLEFEERSLVFTLNQLLGRDWAIGARYRITEADLKAKYTRIPPRVLNNGTSFLPRNSYHATIYQATMYAIYNHPSGFFLMGEATWTGQDNSLALSSQQAEDFWQFNTFIGYRFAQRRAEIAFGVLNLTDRGYHLEPLTLYNELPRERMFVTRFKFKF